MYKKEFVFKKQFPDIFLTQLSV